MEKNISTSDKFKNYWSKSLLWSYFPHFFALLEFVYLLDKGCYLYYYDDRFFKDGHLINSYKVFSKQSYYNERSFVYARYFIASSILLVLPFFDLGKAKYMMLIITAILFLYCMFTLDGIFQRRQSFLTLYMMTIFFRVVRYQSFFDNFALCFSYLLEFNGMTPSSYHFFSTNAVFVWLFFFISLYLSNTFFRVYFRLWDSIRLLLVLKRKTTIAKIEMNTIIETNLSVCILNNILPDLKAGISSPFIENLPEEQKSNDINRQEKEQEKVNENSDVLFHNKHSNYFINLAIEKKLIIPYTEGSLKIEDLKRIRGVDRRKAVLIGAAIDKGGSRDCALAVERERKFFDMMDMIAKEYNITPIRRFGRVWVSLMGFFNNKNTSRYIKNNKFDSTNCYYSLLFCIDVKKIATDLGIKITFALEMNHITGGFVESYKFDIFGPEIRWVMRMLDTNCNEIIIGDTVMYHANMKKKQKFEISIGFDRKMVSFPWEKDTKDEIIIVHNLSDLYKYLEEERKRKALTIFSKYYLIISKYDSINLEYPLISIYNIFQQQSSKLKTDSSHKANTSISANSVANDSNNPVSSNSFTLRNAFSKGSFFSSNSINYEDRFKINSLTNNSNVGSSNSIANHPASSNQTSVNNNISNITNITNSNATTNLAHPTNLNNIALDKNAPNTSTTVSKSEKKSDDPVSFFQSEIVDPFELKKIEDEKLMKFFCIIHSLKKGIQDISSESLIISNFLPKHASFQQNVRPKKTIEDYPISNVTSAVEFLLDSILPTTHNSLVDSTTSTTLNNEYDETEIANITSLLEQYNISPSDPILDDFLSSDCLTKFYSLDEISLIKLNENKKKSSSNSSILLFIFHPFISFYNMFFKSLENNNSTASSGFGSNFLTTLLTSDEEQRIMQDNLKSCVRKVSYPNFLFIFGLFDEDVFSKSNKKESLVMDGYILDFLKIIYNQLFKIKGKNKEKYSISSSETKENSFELFKREDEEIVNAKISEKSENILINENDNLNLKVKEKIKKHKRNRLLTNLLEFLLDHDILERFKEHDFCTFDEFVKAIGSDITRLNVFYAVLLSIEHSNYNLFFFITKLRWQYFLKASDYNSININTDTIDYHIFYSKTFFQVNIRLFIEESWESYYHLIEFIESKPFLQYIINVISNFFSKSSNKISPLYQTQLPLTYHKVSSPDSVESSSTQDQQVELTKSVQKRSHCNHKTTITNSIFNKLLNWRDYSTINKTMYTNNLLTTFIEIIIFFSTIYSIKSILLLELNDINKQERFNISLFTIIFIVYWILSQTILRSEGFIIILFLHGLIYIFFPITLLKNFNNNGGIFPIYNPNKIFYGDFGGDVLFSIFLTFHIPISLHQHPYIVYIDIILYKIIFFIRTIAVDNDYYSTLNNSAYNFFNTSSEISIICILLIIGVVIWFMQIVIYITYLVENKLIPHSLKQYELQLYDIKYFDKHINDNVPPFLLANRSSPKWFRNSMIICVHIKAADTMASLLPARDLATVMKILSKIVITAFDEFGFLSISNFSGIHVGMIYRSLDLPTSINKANNDVNFIDTIESKSPIVLLILTLQERMEKIGRSHGFNVSLGISLNYGSTYVGFLNNQYSFEVEGRCRDMAVSMASQNQEAIYISRMFEPSIVNQFYRYGTVNKQKTYEDNSPSSYWLKVDNSFSGMQLTDFIYVGILGKGGYGSVHLVKEKNTYMDYAVKTIQLKASSRLPKMIQRECLILQRMHHPNVVSLKCSFITNNQLYLVMDFVKGGNLKQVLEKNFGSITLNHLRSWFADLVRAIDYIHKMNIIHRDVKPANCMIGINGTLKLADFGLSKFNPLSQNKFKSESSSLGINIEELEKLRKFLPLNTHLASLDTNRNIKISVTVLLLQVNFSIKNKNSSNNNLDNSDNENLNTVPPVFQFENAHTYVWDFISFSMNIIITHTLESAQSYIIERNVDAIFVNVFYDDLLGSHISNDEVSNQSISFIIRELDNDVLKIIPIYIFGVHPKLHSEFKDAGAKECFDHLAVNRFCHGVDVTNGRYNFYFVEESELDPVKHPYSLNIICGFTSKERELYRRLFNIRDDLYGISYSNNSPRFSDQSIIEEENSNQLWEANDRGRVAEVEELVPSKSQNLSNHKISNSINQKDHSIQQSNDPEENQIVGTLHFIAPEVLQYHVQNELIDWWACGITMYFACVRENLFRGDNKEAIKKNIIEGVIDLQPIGGPLVYSKLRKLGAKEDAPSNDVQVPNVSKSAPPSTRPLNENEIDPSNVIGYGDPDLIDLLQKFINRDCNARLGKNFAEICSHPFFNNILSQNKKGQDDTSTSDSQSDSLINLRHLPQIYEPQVYSLKDKFNFFGTNNTSSSSYESREKHSQLMMERRNFYAMKNYEINRKKSRNINKSIKRNGNNIINDIQKVESLITGKVIPDANKPLNPSGNIYKGETSLGYVDSEIVQIQEESIEDIEREFLVE